MTNRFKAGIFGALALLGTGFAALPASAAPVSAAPVAAASAAGDLLQQVQYYGPRRGYHGPRRHYGRPVYRPRCFWSDRRVWNGYRWVVRPVRICR